MRLLFVSISDQVAQLNSIEILLGCLLGILGSFVYAKTTERIRSQRITNRYKKIEGVYLRFWEENGSREKEKIFVTAELKQIVESQFEIVVRTLLHYGITNPCAGLPYSSENIEIWSGEIIMDSLRNGTVVWNQKNPANGNNGFKRIIIETNYSGMTLIGEKDGGFGVEKFTSKIVTRK